jgi:hypothetical protein
MEGDLGRALLMRWKRVDANDPEMMTYAIAGLAFVAITGLGMVFAGGGDAASSRSA